MCDGDLMADLVSCIPDHVQEVLRRLEGAGYQAVLVGGCVRDLILGREVQDWDVATDALPERVRALFPRTVPTGIEHGTVTVVTKEGNVEVTTFRVESAYSDYRHPDQVAFTRDLRQDLGRRDFTINAMALDLAGRLHDPFGGRHDLESRRLRAVGDPQARFREDPLRLMRLVRFAAELDFRPEEETMEAARRAAPLLRHISAERIRDELSRILLSERPDFGLQLCLELGLLKVFLPELEEGVGVAQNVHHAYDVWTHALKATAAIPPRLELRLAALLHDVAKPRCLREENGERHFYNHELVGAAMVERILRRLKFDRRTIERVVHLVRHHMALHYQRGMTDAAIRRLINRVGLENMDDLLALRRADREASGVKRGPVSRGTARLLRRVEKVLAEDAAFGLGDLAVDGHDVMRIAGIEPGPEVGHILRRLLEAVLEDPKLNTRPALEDLILEIARERGLPGPVESPR